ncbi:MAG: hypothetical protein HZC38_05270 [Chloroflexi bacterium]|nr:hypothetical protein [Chloroflexota bacterium]
MTTSTELLTLVVTTLQTSEICRNVRVIETQQFSDEQFALKVRCEITTGGELQVRLYQNSEHVDYAYQLFQDEQPVIRWDNKEHFPEIATHPHHFHNPSGGVNESALNGNADHDLPLVLNHLATLVLTPSSDSDH